MILHQLIDQLTQAAPKRNDGAERQAKHLAKKIAERGIDAVRQGYKDSYYRRRESILAKRKAKRAQAYKEK